MRPFCRHPVCAIVTTVPFLCMAILGPSAGACTRAVYLGKEGMVVAGRSMDWKEDLQSNLWVFARAMQRDGGLGVASLK